MMANVIQLDDLEIDASYGTSVIVEPKFSKGVLAGIDLNFRVWDDTTVVRVEDVFKHTQIEVNDPYVGRNYRATGKITQFSYQEGRAGRSYVAEVREIDMPPAVTHIEINNVVFEVAKYSEREDSDNRIIRQALFRLSETQFRELQTVTKDDKIKIRRLDVDDIPLEAEPRG